MGLSHAFFYAQCDGPNCETEEQQIEITGNDCHQHNAFEAAQELQEKGWLIDFQNLNLEIFCCQKCLDDFR